MSRHPIWELLDKLQMDAVEHKTRIDNLRMEFAAIELPATPKQLCPTCRTSFRTHLLRDEHVYNAHAGPVPEHYLAAERAAGITLTDEPAPAVPEHIARRAEIRDRG